MQLDDGVQPNAAKVGAHQVPRLSSVTLDASGWERAHDCEGHSKKAAADSYASKTCSAKLRR